MLQLNDSARAALALALLLTLAACGTRPQAPQPVAPAGSTASVAQALARLDSLLPADAILLGEQHDAPEHQMIAQQIVAALAAQNRLAALTIEMADAGNGTGALKPGASEDDARLALKWNERGWPWRAYGPVVMAAVRAGVPVLGANLPASQTRPAMADTTLDSELPAKAMQTQQESIRSGHCDLLPASQLLPMARVQIARDRSIAQTITQAALPGKVVVLLAGSGHVNRELGVPHYLPLTLDVRAVRMAADGGAVSDAGQFDSVWLTPPTPPRDYCADLRKQMAPRSAPAAFLTPSPSGRGRGLHAAAPDAPVRVWTA